MLCKLQSAEPTGVDSLFLIQCFLILENLKNKGIQTWTKSFLRIIALSHNKMSHSNIWGSSSPSVRWPYLSHSYLGLWFSESRKHKKNKNSQKRVPPRSFYIPLKSTSSMMECVIIIYTHMHLPAYTCKYLIWHFWMLSQNVHRWIARKL